MKNHIKQGWGFEVGQDFARATKDTPIELAPAEYAKPGSVIGYVAEDPASSLGFLRRGSNGKVRVHVPTAEAGAIPVSLDTGERGTRRELPDPAERLALDRSRGARFGSALAADV